MSTHREHWYLGVNEKGWNFSQKLWICAQKTLDLCDAQPLGFVLCAAMAKLQVKSLASG